MDSISKRLIGDSIKLDRKIAALLASLDAFAHTVREARADLDAVSRELHSLQAVLGLLGEEAPLLPADIAVQGPALLEHCSGAVDQLDEYVSTLDRLGLSRLEKRTHWLGTGRLETASFASTLEAHRVTIGLSLDLAQATATCDPILPHQGRTDCEVMIDISRILIQMDQLRTRLPEEFEKSPSYFSLHEYMVHLKRYADTVISRREALYENKVPPQSHLIDWTEREPESGPYLGGDHMFGAYVGDGPDSAIDSDTEIQWPVPPSLPVRSKDGPLSPIDEMREPSVDIPSRAPTPPPKDAKRLRLLEMKRLELAAKSLMPSVPEQAKIPPPLPERRRPKTAQTSLETRQAEHPKKLQKRVARVRSQERMYVPSIISTRSRGWGRLFASSSSKKSIAESGRSTAPSITTTTASTTPDIRPITPVVQASVVRRRSGRLSIHLKKLPLWNLDLLDENPSSTSSTSSSTSNSKAVFGVSLQKSMQTAKGITKTHHSGDRSSSSSSSSSFSSSSSRREFPLCMQKCCFHLQNHGVTAPDIFTEPGDIFRVSKLKEIFSQAPRYGADLDLANNNNNNNNINNNNYYYTAYDVADLIMLFLSQLPRPLVPESLAKRWVALSRRVARAEAHAATRLDGCIDFWEEALSGLRGPSRSLVKLLLNLWADVAAAEKENDMSAERLAAVVLKPLTHVARGQQRTDYALALAFLIRKRVEYAELLGQNRSAMNRIRRAAW